MDGRSGALQPRAGCEARRFYRPAAPGMHNRSMTSEGERRLPPVLRVADVRALEARHAGEPLMERAGAAAAAVARALAGDRGRPVVVLAGPGNNGGDGFALARCLKEAYYDVVVVFRDDATRLPADAAAAHARYADAGGSTVTSLPGGAPALVIDALFGIGMTRPLARQHAELVEWANRQNVPRLALDVPTGLDADRGIARAPSFKATATVTFIALKPGLLTADGPAACGEVSVNDLGIDAHEVAGAGRMLDWATLRASLPEPLRRKLRNAHKGTFGTLGIIGGAEGLVGAALIAARAAARAGAGKVRVGVLAANRPSVDFVMPESMLTSVDAVLEASADALVVGWRWSSDADWAPATTP
jgi:ADP-dependent NAD(P)H-hydrate dehydratase / NAD(P)H-hydrate epimerase